MLDALHKTLASEAKAALTQTQVISGLGGIGKTQTALEYAYKYRSEYDYIFWIRADSEFTIQTDFVQIAEKLNLLEKNDEQSAVIVAAVKRFLSAAHNSWLIIFDNVEDPELIVKYRPDKSNGHILLTSRSHTFDVLGITSSTELGEMAPEEALQFLLKRTGRENQQLSVETRLAAEQLTEELGYLPLALEQAGAYILKRQTLIPDYLVSYRKRRILLLEQQKPVIGDNKKSVATTWAINFAQVEEESPAAADLLRCSAFLNPDNIPFAILTGAATKLGPHLSDALFGADEDPVILDEVLFPLLQYSLIKRNQTFPAYSIHRLVQEVLKQDLADADTQDIWIKRTVDAVSYVFPQPEYANWFLCAALLPHTLTCKALVEGKCLTSAEIGRMYDYAGWYLVDRGQYSSAEPQFLLGKEIREKALGFEHPDVAMSLHNLATLYRNLGRYKEAEALHLQVLEMRRKLLGADHLDIAMSLNNLATLYHDIGRYREAEALHLQALVMRRRLFGAEHRDIALKSGQSCYGSPLFRSLQRGGASASTSFRDAPKTLGGGTPSCCSEPQ